MPPYLSENLSLRNLAKRLQEGAYQNVIVMVGAGISVSCGIPDFRSPGTGLYDNLEKYNLPTPQHVFDLSFFKQTKGNAFYTLAKELWPSNYKPSPGHLFIKILSDKGLLLRCYTQNIDTLERQAGIPSEKLVEAHGSFSKASCVNCSLSYDIKLFEEKLRNDKTPILCESCEGLVKPNIVFFGESLPDRFGQLLKPDFQKCDLLLIMGTSLTVHPFASLIGLVGPKVPRLLLNMETVGIRTPYTMNYGLRLFQESNERDLFIKGTLDNAVRALCDLVGWREDLERLVDNDVEEFIPIDWRECFGNITPDFNFRFVHNSSCRDWPALVDCIEGQSVKKRQDMDLEGLLKGLSLSDENIHALLISSVDKGVFYLQLFPEALKEWDEDDYVAVVNKGTTELKEEWFLSVYSLHSPSYENINNQEIATFLVDLREAEIVEGEIWYISNETGRVKHRYRAEFV